MAKKKSPSKKSVVENRKPITDETVTDGSHDGTLDEPETLVETDTGFGSLVVDARPEPDPEEPEANGRWPEGVKLTTKVVSVKLTDEELLSRGLAAANFAANFRQEDDRFAQVKRDWKTKLDEIEAKRDMNLRAIESGHEDRKMELEIVKNYDANLVCFRGPDGRVYEEREMRPEERQEEMAVVTYEDPHEQPTPSDAKAPIDLSVKRKIKRAKQNVVDEDDAKAARESLYGGLHADPRFDGHTSPDEETLAIARRAAEIEEVRREETSKKSKRSAVDRVTPDTH